MAKINRKYIDKHWSVFLFRGALGAAFGCFALFSGMTNFDNVIAVISIFLLLMGIIDAVGALYCSNKKHGWFNSVIDAAIDVAAAVTLLFMGSNIANVVVIISIYTIASGVVDIFHSFLSTIDPTDQFIRVLAGVIGCVFGLVIVNAGDFEISIFIRFFGAYMMIVGVTSLIYGAHNRSQEIEDKIARSNSAKKKIIKKHTRKK